MVILNSVASPCFPIVRGTMEADDGGKNSSYSQSLDITIGNQRNKPKREKDEVTVQARI